MPDAFFIRNATIINEGLSVQGSLFVSGGVIRRIYPAALSPDIPAGAMVIDATGQWLLPGVIDTHVHFREPGATHKACIASETRAAAAGGVTSFIDMPNNMPATTTLELLEEKCRHAATTSLLNYSFYLGATNDNLEEIKRIKPAEVGGVKLFLGSSTGNMLVDNETTIAAIFAEAPVLTAVHSEDDMLVRRNLNALVARHSGALQAGDHPRIRTAEACLRSTERVMKLASKYRAAVHILHVTTAGECALFQPGAAITAEACIPHLWFDGAAYAHWQNFVKCNPAIKTAADREALRRAVTNGCITTVATDHAPHTRSEKQQPYLQAPSGMPSVQYSLPLMLELCREKIFTPEMVVERMCHAPARLFKIARRGFIREGYYADLTLVHPDREWRITDATVLSKCGWTPYAGTTVHTQVTHTFINGTPVFMNGAINDAAKGQRLLFTA
ncbi:MAG: dihydroorotase [Prevotellaceae bacterium]|jgi:dihydroorotase|nr:dihydroorotase [Prevotellaceae bacterium]